MNLSHIPGAVYHIIPDYAVDFERETGGSALDPAVLLEGASQPSQAKFLRYCPLAPHPEPLWVQNTWAAPFLLRFASISEAARALRGMQRNWAPALFTQYRRGALIAEQLPPLPSKPRPFPFGVPGTPMGAWTLLDGNTLLGSALCSSPFPGGVIQFQENRAEPPSRAYLKLWEAFTLAGRRPGPGERCLDAGASPGGWTWVIARLGAEVVAVDRAPLAPGAAGLPGVRFLRHDAFTLRMRDLEPVDWVFSDVACYPPKLLAWVTAWLEAGYRGNFICTIKMQGNADLESTRRFSALGGRVLHLWHNKHELTWIFISH